MGRNGLLVTKGQDDITLVLGLYSIFDEQNVNKISNSILLATIFGTIV